MIMLEIQFRTWLPESPVHMFCPPMRYMLEAPQDFLGWLRGRTGIAVSS